ncbi:hypothetical protein niasHT_018138 [Heterodera trifolii]|uniref:Uncharacterized protein n=1 Tax=Heterodera trifolii TaxID=157864 RepID=A0ABD2LJV0_9BILA
MANTVAKISRDELLEFVRNEVTCTIGSADAPVAIPVLITTFREDTNEDILQLAKKLGYPSIEAMLDSVELSDIVEPCFTDLAKGAGNENPKKVFSYRIKNIPMVTHILSSIEESVQHRDKKAEKQRYFELLIGDPKYNPKILAGKEQLLSLIYNLGGQERFVDLLELRKLYEQNYFKELNKAALKQFFPTGQLKGIMDKYLYQDIELATDQNKNGSLLFRLKRPYNDICEEIARIMKEREEYKEIQQKLTQNKRNSKKPKGPAQQPKKLRVINPPPPPKPKPIPLVKSMVQRRSDLYTDDPTLYHKITTISGRENENGEEHNRMNGTVVEEEGSENGKTMKYTTRVEGATYTDEEEENVNEADESDTENEEEEDQFGKDENECQAQKGNLIAVTNTKSEKGNGEMVEEDRAAKRMVLVQRMLEERKAFHEQVKMRNEVSGEVKGVFMETKRTGRKAREEEARRERVSNLLEKMGKMEPMAVDDRMNEKSKRRIAILVVELIWANRELGFSEVKNMLSLLFGHNVQIDVEHFVKNYCKCLKTVRAPIEPHLVIADENRRQIGQEIEARSGRFSRKTLIN